MPRPDSSRPVRIGNCSGFYGDRLAAMEEMLRGGELDVITGDYLAELTMLILGKDTLRDPELGYAKTFLRQLETCLPLAIEKGVRIVANAGGLNPRGLAAKVRELAAEQGLDPAVASVAIVEGDDLRDKAAELGVPGAITANAYLGGFGIVRALDAGAAVVITGRVTDASLTVGPAAWWHGWTPADLDPIAGAMAAGHVIECGTQATGGNYSFFAQAGLDDGGPRDLLWPGYPIAEIGSTGESIITKHAGTGGAVTVGTVSAQLLYEVASPSYLGPDATLRLDTIALEQAGDDRVRISGCRADPPPATLKVATTAIGGWRNEIALLLTGLDIEAKAVLFERQLRARLDPPPEKLEFRLARTDRPDAPTEAEASATLTVVARDSESERVGKQFSGAAVELALASYPGATPTAPPGKPSPYGVYVAARVPAGEVPHRVELPGGELEVVAPSPLAGEPAIVPGPDAETHSAQAASAGAAARTDVIHAPLGRIAAARSGDKGGDANIGVWVEDPAAWHWLRETLTASAVRTLLPETRDLDIERFELPNLLAVNFVIHGILGRGVAEGARFDPQAKGLGEWLRSRFVDVPRELLPPGYTPEDDGAARRAPGGER
ncbi:acyclic terpene utilization AtuA family protein [Dietzia sp.]|uniref:acyclic terpene utilization AtuA family protein n=1 Tax=Dietzia sp. TaxID=1871616 RepID=UPI002FD87DC3